MKRSFFQYVSLNVLGALGLSGYILADTLFVAHRLGTDGLAASTWPSRSSASSTGWG